MTPPSSQAKTKFLRTTSVRYSTLPPGHSENGTVRTDHPTRPTPHRISGPAAISDSRLRSRSTNNITSAKIAADKAIRSGARAGKYAAGDRNMTALRSTSGQHELTALHSAAAVLFAPGSAP